MEMAINQTTLIILVVILLSVTIAFVMLYVYPGANLGLDQIFSKFG